MLYSDLKGRKLVSTSTADTLGKVDGFLLDPATHAVVALEFKKTPSGDLVPWGDLTGVGADAVTVAGAEKIVELEGSPMAELGAKDRSVLKKRVLTSTGLEVGTVSDIDLDPTTGIVTDLVLSDRRIAGERLLGVGSYAVVVRAE